MEDGNKSEAEAEADTEAESLSVKMSPFLLRTVIVFPWESVV